jgi:pyridoxamine 5'-phosphate oxidase family protein
MTFTPDELRYLQSQPLGRLATAQPDGTLQVSPVGFTFNESLGTIDIGGFNMAASQKYRNVAANGRAAIVVDDVPSTDPWRVRCLEIRGTAQTVPATESAGPLIRITPRRIIAFGITDTGQEPHEMTVNKRDVPATS